MFLCIKEPIEGPSKYKMLGRWSGEVRGILGVYSIQPETIGQMICLHCISLVPNGYCPLQTLKKKNTAYSICHDICIQLFFLSSRQALLETFSPVKSISRFLWICLPSPSRQTVSQFCTNNKTLSMGLWPSRRIKGCLKDISSCNWIGILKGPILNT